MSKPNFFIFAMLLAVLFFNSSFAREQDRGFTTVGKQPAYLFGPSECFYVFCLGYDADFDGVFDSETDELPSLWNIGLPKICAIPGPYKDGEIWIQKEKICDFAFGTPGFPLRPFVDGDYLYFHQNGYIRKIYVRSGAQLDSIAFEHDVHGLTIYNNKMYVSTRVVPDGAWVPEDNFVVVIDMMYKTALDTIPADMNVQMTKIIDNHIFVLNEGLGADDDSFVKMYNLLPNESGEYEIINSFSAGRTGNFFALDDDYRNIFIVSNGSHKVIKYSLVEDVDPIDFNLPTSGYNGPREIVMSDNWNGKFRVSTYDGNAYEFNQSGPDSIVSYKGHGLGEGMIWGKYDYTFVIANISNPDYSPNDTVTIFAYPQTSVKEIDTKVSIYPNPAVDFVNISIEDNQTSFDKYEIFALDGKRIGEGSLFFDNSETSINISRFDLPVGKYMLRISNASNELMLPLMISK